MAVRPALDRAPDRPAHSGSRFERRDRAAAARQAALRLARDARALPENERRLYLRMLRSAARRGGLAALAALELEGPRLAEPRIQERVAEPRVEEPQPAEPQVEEPRLAEPHAAARVSRRSLSAIALTGVLVGMAVAVLLPASLSETLPGTSGNGRDQVLARPTPSAEADRDSKSGSAAANAPAAGARRGSGRPSDRRLAARGRRLTATGGVWGVGNRTIGTLRVDRPMRLRWKSRGASLAIVSEGWRFRPRGDSGTTVLTPGTYREFGIRSSGSWTLELDPAGD